MKLSIFFFCFYKIWNFKISIRNFCEDCHRNIDKNSLENNNNCGKSSLSFEILSFCHNVKFQSLKKMKFLIFKIPKSNFYEDSQGTLRKTGWKRIITVGVAFWNFPIGNNIKFQSFLKHLKFQNSYKQLVWVWSENVWFKKNNNCRRSSILKFPLPWGPT